ncbi:hypothetical protein AHAS_Ahas13G0277400 [Arachis hypogaea]
MGYFPPPQNDASHDSNGGWEYYQETANSEQSSHMRDCPIAKDSQPKQTSNSQRLSKLESMLKRFTEETKKYWEEQETSLKNMEVQLAQLVSAMKKEEKQEEDATESSEFLVKKEEMVEIVENETTLEI